MHVLDRERLVCRRYAGRQAAFVRPAHGHVRSGHVTVDEDPVDVVPQIAEARAQPLARRGGAARPFRRSGSASLLTKAGCTSCPASSVSPPASTRVISASTTLRSVAASAMARVYSLAYWIWS